MIYYILIAFGLWAVYMVLFGHNKYTGEPAGLLGEAPGYVNVMFLVIIILLLTIGILSL
jgi:hypothetical protein